MIAEITLPVPIHKTFDYLIPASVSASDISDLVGKRVRVPFGRTYLTGVVWKIKETSEFPVARLKPFSQVIDEEPVMGEELRSLADWMSIRYACSLGDAVFAMLPSGTSPAETNAQIYREPVFTRVESQFPEIGKEFQSSLYDGKSNAFFVQSRRLEERLEVYLAFVSDVLAKQKTVLFLVPEIRLGAPVFHALVEKFGDAVCFWNSEDSRKNQEALWWKIKNGNASVVVGARSAVLLPLSDLGAIIVEEEFSGAYKEERRPRFQARDVARFRCQKASASFVLGASVPSVETFQGIVEGEVKQLIVPLPPAAAPVTVRMIDMKSEGRKGRLSPALKEALSERLRRGQKSILFLNRKGTYKSVRCAKCEWVSPYDQKTNLPTKCPQCSHAKLKLSGFGTSTLLSDVQKEFPWAKVARWDAGVALAENMPTEFDILVGTELVTHGFHFPGVSLVGLVDADISLRIPDFRASEKTFQTLVHLLEQMETHSVGAEMIIQTRHPDHEAFVRLQNKQVFEFFSAELKFRSELNYPPFSHLMTVRSEEKSDIKAEKSLGEFLTWVASVDSVGAIGILGPTLQSVSRKKAKILQCLLKIPKEIFPDFMLQLSAFLSAKSRRLWLDVDPEH